MSREPFGRVDVSAWEVTAIETSGVEEKMWLLNRSAGERVSWLFKSVTLGEEYSCGEDLAEKAAAEFGLLFGIPCARVELAVRNGRRGSISRSLKPEDRDLQHGSLLMQARGVPGYVPGKTPGRPGHTPENIRDVLQGALPPPHCELPFQATAYDVFAGFTLFDAVIANCDRHDENWAVLLPAAGEGDIRLCGSYDHANSLGYNLTDKKREMYLTRDDGVCGWCRKGKANRFEYTPRKPIRTLVDLAIRAIGLASPEAREYWLARLGQVSDDDIRDPVARLPGLSVPARTFTTEVVLVNRKRVLDACQ